MANQIERPPDLQIYRVDTKGKILDFTDFILLESKRNRLSEGKITMNYVEYNTDTNKAITTLKHYLDVPTARVLFDDILNFRFRKDPGKADMFLPVLDEYKGGSGEAAGHPEWEFASRHLTVVYNPTLRIGPCITFNFTLCQGKETTSKAILPLSQEGAVKGSINVPLNNARYAAATILDFITCKQTSAMITANMSEMWDEIDKTSRRVDRIQQLVETLAAKEGISKQAA